jgi:hypothetical protein
VAGGWCWTGVREKHCWLAGNQPAEQGLHVCKFYTYFFIVAQAAAIRLLACPGVQALIYSISWRGKKNGVQLHVWHKGNVNMENLKHDRHRKNRVNYCYLRVLLYLLFSLLRFV